VAIDLSASTVLEDSRAEDLGIDNKWTRALAAWASIWAFPTTVCPRAQHFTTGTVTFEAETVLIVLGRRTQNPEATNDEGWWTDEICAEDYSLETFFQTNAHDLFFRKSTARKRSNMKKKISTKKSGPVSTP